MSMKLKLATALVLSLAGTATMAWLLWPNDLVSLAAFRKIHIGMRQAEVAAILGNAGEGYADYLTTFESMEDGPEVIETVVDAGAGEFIGGTGVIVCGNGLPTRKEGNIRCWTGREGVICVYVDQNRRVTTRIFERWRAASLWERMLSLFSWIRVSRR